MTAIAGIETFRPPTRVGALLVAGTASDAGKSFVVAALCRWLARKGFRVAPFKAQNMSNNSVVTLDGGEIGRAQAWQAAAAGLEPSVRFNPVLLKPGSDRRSQLVVRGVPRGDVGAQDYLEHRTELREIVADELEGLRRQFDAVICEGAGSPSEINLRATDLANMGLAETADLPVIVVADIDRGGALAHLYGTIAVLDAVDQQRVAGFVINKFRGDPALLEPGLAELAERTGRPTLGVLPFVDRVNLDTEDSLGAEIGPVAGTKHPPFGNDRLEVAAVRLPRVSNSTDVAALACEPGVDVSWVDTPDRIRAADLIVLPGSKSTVADLKWLRGSGIAFALVDRAKAGKPILAICGGYQMLARTIDDPVESGEGRVNGLGLLDLTIEFRPRKVTRQVAGTALESPVSGYEIHHGVVTHNGDERLITRPDGRAEGSARGAILGTHWHGLLENDAFRRRLLMDVARRNGKGAFIVAPDTAIADERQAQFDQLADLIDEHLDTAALLTLLGLTQ